MAEKKEEEMNRKGKKGKRKTMNWNIQPSVGLTLRCKRLRDDDFTLRANATTFSDSIF